MNLCFHLFIQQLDANQEPGAILNALSYTLKSDECGGHSGSCLQSCRAPTVGLHSRLSMEAGHHSDRWQWQHVTTLGQGSQQPNYLG